MKRPRDCIICGKASGSGEHIFPAALGGRRTSNGIYCAVHNGCFGPLVSYLQQDLSMMNALLEIRPDRHDSAKSFHFDAEGSRYKLLGDDISVAPPDPSDPANIPPLNEPVDRYFSSEKEAEEWVREIEKHGVKVKITKRQEARRVYKVDPYRITLKFGGHEVLHAVAYLALSFFAQYYPREARQESLIDLKNLLLRPVNGDDVWAGDYVWWEGGGPVDVVRDNPYRFGHTVIVGVKSGSNQACAYISFFSCLNFSVRLGQVQPSEEMRSVVVYIDPEAQTAANSCLERKSLELDKRVGEKLVNLGVMIQSGMAESAVGDFLRRVSRAKSERLLEEMRGHLDVLKSATSDERFNVCLMIVDGYSGYVLQQFRWLIKDAQKQFIDSGPQYDRIVKYLGVFMVECSESSNGLSRETAEMLHASCQLLAGEIFMRFTHGDLSAEDIVELIQGAGGVNFLKAKVLTHILNVPLKDG